MVIGALATAEANLRRSIALGREIGDEFREAIGHRSWAGCWRTGARGPSRSRNCDTALEVFDKLGKDKQTRASTWAYRVLAALLMTRAQPPIPNPESPISSARRALELADETARTGYPHERDYVHAHWLLGAALAAALVICDEADRHLTEALARCRAINAVETRRTSCSTWRGCGGGRPSPPAPLPRRERGESRGKKRCAWPRRR